ncbi:MAG: hypothetical protein FJ125_02765, partial [Deltaproteobacteria bacterium]|nr:hypothetical protein [Deltaproteobacteria bacterium]
ALRIPPRPGLPELLDICAELAAELSARQAAGLAEQGGAAPDLLAQEPELLHWLPACLERLVELGAEPPPRLPLVVQQASGGALAVLLAPSGRLFLPEPGELADAARSAALDLCFPALIDLEPPVTRWLAGLGLGDLWGIWSVHRMRWEEQQAEERGWTQLERALAALGRLAPELRGHPAVAAAWCWDPLRWPERVVPVRRLQAEGELGGASITVTLPCALDPDGGHLLATTLLLEDPLPLAWLLLRSRILDAPVPAELAEEVACMLRTGDAGPLRRLLQPAGAPLAGPGKEAAAQAEAGAEAVLQQGAAALRGAGALPPEQGRPAEVNRPSPAAPSFPAQKPRAPAGRQEGPAAKPRVPVRAPAQDRAQPPPRAPAPVRGTARAQERPTREPTELSPPPARPPAGPGLLERLRRLWQRPEPPAAARRSQAGTAGEQPEAGEAAEAGPRSPARRPPASPPRGRTSAGDPRALPPLDDQGRPSGASDEGSWFSPRGSVEPQLRSAAAWLADRGRAPTLGFAFAPPRLPLPWLYAPKLVGERFERRGQRWVEAGAPAVWGRPAGPGTGELVLRGRVPAGEVLLPLPHYGRLLSVEADPPPRLLSLPDGRSLLVAKQPLELICRVALDEPPRFEEGGDEPPDAPHHLLDPTVPDHELPEELHAALAALQASPIGPLPRALALRDLVRRRYRYDPSYMERPELATWLAELAAGRPNAHLAVLHAGRDAEVLGRGVCYELNVLLCELLRRCGFPAAVATGWVLDGGSLADPDHLWALALLPTPQGPRWLPLDASSTEQGRPLRVGRRPPGRWRPPSSRGLGAVRAPSWSSGRASAGSAAAVAEALARRELPLLELERVARHLEQQAGRPPLEAVRLRRHLRDILEDPARLRALLELLWPDRL